MYVRVTEPLQYLPYINARRGDKPPLKADDIVECACCPAHFRIRDAVAFDAHCDGDPIIGLFCSTECLLEKMPVQCCGKA